MRYMIHLRNRLVLQVLLKRLKYFRVVAMQGARQTGKSFLAREILKNKFKKSKYLTFDQQSLLAHAKDQTHTFLKDYSDFSPLIIDEAQKVPEIFDAIKYEVDLDQTPGKYLLLGSTEFSYLTKIREALTGRLGRVRIYPMNISETIGTHLKKAITRAQFVKYLNDGGMPAIFSVRDEHAKTALFEDWIQLTCTRDIQQLKTLKLDPDLTYQILAHCAKLEEPTRVTIARALHEDSRRIETHLRALCEIFVLHRLNPHPLSKGKPIYLVLDPGIANYLGASWMKRLHITLLNEQLCKNTYIDKKKKQFFYYRSTGKNLLHLIAEGLDGSREVFQLFDREQIKKTDLELMRSFMSRNPGSKGIFFAPVLEASPREKISILPLEKMGIPTLLSILTFFVTFSLPWFSPFALSAEKESIAPKSKAALALPPGPNTPVWKREGKLLITKAPPRITNLEWRNEDAVLLETLPTTWKGLGIEAMIEGRYRRTHWTLSCNGVGIKTGKDGHFRLNSFLTHKETTLHVFAKGPSGEKEEETLRVYVPGWESFIVLAKKRFPKRSVFNFYLGITGISYSESLFDIGKNIDIPTKFTEYASTVRFSYNYMLIPPHWNAGISAYFTIAALPQASKLGLRFLGVNFRFGYLFDQVGAWQYGLYGGYYYTSTFVINSSSGKYGFANMLGPQLYPALRKELKDGASIFTYLKFSPVSTQFNFVTFTSYELAGGASYSFHMGNGHPLNIGLDISRLHFNVSFPTALFTGNSRTLSLGVGYGF